MFNSRKKVFKEMEKLIDYSDPMLSWHAMVMLIKNELRNK